MADLVAGKIVQVVPDCVVPVRPAAFIFADKPAGWWHTRPALRSLFRWIPLLRFTRQLRKRTSPRRLAVGLSLRSQRPESGRFDPPVLISGYLERRGAVNSARRAAELRRIEYLVQVQEEDSRVLKDPGRKKNQFSRDHKGDYLQRESLPPKVGRRGRGQHHPQSI